MGSDRARETTSSQRLGVDVLGPIRARDPDGRDITPDEAKTVIEKGKVGPLQLRDRAGEFEGYLVLIDEKAGEVQRESDGSAEAAA